MRKIISSLLILGINSVVFSGELGIEKYVDNNVTPNNPINISYESINEIKNVKYDLDINNPTTGILNNINIGAYLYYKPEPASLKTNDFLEFHLSNAFTHEDTGNCWLIFDEDKALDTDNDSIPDSMYDLNNDGDYKDLWIIGFTPDFVGSSNTIDFIISANGQLLPNNMVLILGCQDITKPYEVSINDVDEDGTENADFDPKYNLILSIDSQDITDKVCISVSGFDGFGNPIPNLNASEKCILSYEYQFNFETLPTISTIDIYSPSEGKNFVQKTTNILTSSEDTELIASGGVIKIDNDSDNSIDDYINLDLNPANFNLKIWSDLYGCSDDFGYDSGGYPALDLDNQRIFLSGDGDELIDGTRFAFNEGTFEKGINGACNLNLTIGETTGDIQIPHGSVWKDDIYVGINGNERLRYVKWQLDENFEITNMNYSKMLSSTNLPERFFKKWEPNGTTLWAPILNKWNTSVVISHNNPGKISQVPASNIPITHDTIEIRTKIWDKDEEWCDNILIGKFTDQGRIIIKGKDIWNKAKIECPSVDINGQFSALFTISAPERDIEATVLQTTKKGIRNLPIYQNKERIDDLRNINDDTDIHTN